MAKYDEDPFDYEEEDEEGFMTFDARDEKDGAGRGPYILAGIVLLLLVFGAIVFAISKGGKSNDGQTPQVAANSESFKETPIEGDVSANAIDGADAVNAVGANAPPPLEVRAMGASEEPLVSQNAVSSPTTATKPATSVTPPHPAADATKPVAKPAVTPTKPAPVASKSTTTAAAKPATTTPAKPAVKEDSKPASTGSYSAQLGSFKDKAQADAALAKYRSGGLTGAAGVVKADLGAKGTWYRIKATGFESRDQVVAFCSKAKANGANCIPSN